MGKRSPKSPAIIDSNQLGCMFGFSGMFDFHHGRPSQKLLLNDSHGNKTLTGAEQTRSTAKILTSFDENCQRINKKHKKAKKDARIIVDQSPSQAMSLELSLHDEGFCNQIPLKNGLKSISSRRKGYQLDQNNLQIVHTFIDQMEVGKHTREKSLWKRIMKSRYGYPKKGKQNLHPSKSLEILKPNQETMQNLRKERTGKFSAATNRENKKSEPMDLCESASTKPNLPIVVYSKKQESDISLEAKKHLSERLRRVEKVEAVLSKRAPRTLEKILLSSPKHDLAATLSSRWEKNYSSVSTQMRFSPYGNSQLAHEKSLQTWKDSNTFKLDDPFMTDGSSSRGCLEILEISPEQNITDAAKMLEGNRCSEGLILESPSSSTVNICKLQITNRDQEREENPSPVSILEPFFKDDASSPMSSITESPEPPMQPLHLNFDEHLEINFSIDMKDKEIIYAYIKKVYQSSQLDWDEFLANGWPANSSCYQKLLYDYIKEVLIDLHQCYFGSFVKWGIQAVSMEENAVNEVMKEVDWYTIPRTMPLTLDQLVGKDVAKSGKWVDITVDTKDIVIEIVEEALEDSILEMILDMRLQL